MYQSNIDNFELDRKTSTFCNITLGDEEIHWDKCERMGFYPFAFILFLNNNLSKIDGLFTRFQIENLGTKHFKGQLKDSIYSGKLKKYNAIKSAISELLAAEIFSKNETILGLEARGEINVDIKSKSMIGDIWYTEVKYLGEIPELYERVINQKSVAAFWNISDLLTLYTYLSMRIADAVEQLTRKSLNAPCKTRVLILTDSPITANDNILKEVQIGGKWNQSKLSDLCGLFSTTGNAVYPSDYLKKTISEWHSGIDHLIVAYLNKSYNIDFKLEKTKGSQ